MNITADKRMRTKDTEIPEKGRDYELSSNNEKQ